MTNQLPLEVRFYTKSTLQTYCWGNNGACQKALLSLLAGMSSEHAFYLWSPITTGRTHLLQALVNEVGSQKSAFYLPLKRREELDPSMLADWESMALLALDDVSEVVKMPAWEQAFFHVYNRCLAQGTYLVLTGDRAPEQLEWELKDWRSRFRSILSFELKPLSDAEKSQILQDRAKGRGMELKEEVATFLLARYPRDLGILLAVLDRLDKASLAAQRRLTIPFVRSVLEDCV